MSDSKKSKVFELKVGQKGEIYTVQKLRKLLNLRPGDILEAFVKEDHLIAKRKKSALDILDEPPLDIDPLTLDELRVSRKQIQDDLEKRGTQ